MVCAFALQCCTCTGVPEMTTFLESVPGSTSLLILRLQPLCSRSSRILAPALPMRPPAAWLGVRVGVRVRGRVRG